MQDELQRHANIICSTFDLGSPVRLEFAEEFTMRDSKLWTFLLSPRGDDLFSRDDKKAAKQLKWNEKIINKEEKQNIIEARKDFLWTDLLNNPRRSSLFALIEQRDLNIVSAAIKICEGRENQVRLSAKEIDEAQVVAKKISKFHIQGKAIRMFKDLAIKAKSNVNKMPLIQNKKYFEDYIHETIHYILFKKKLFTNYNPFDEGLCTFLHIRYQGKLKTYRMYHSFLHKQHVYLKWVPFFQEEFKEIPNYNIGPILKSRFHLIQQQFKRYLK